MPDAEGLALYDAGLAAGSSDLGPLVEVGTYCGKSAVYLGAAACRTGTLLFSVDHHRGSEELQPGWPHHDPDSRRPGSRGLLIPCPFARRTIREAGLEASVVLVVGESVQVAGAWTAPLALLFIDGGHGAEVAWADYRCWGAKVAVGGTLALHDVFADPDRGGPGAVRHLLPGPDVGGVAGGGSGRLAPPAAPYSGGPPHLNSPT